MRGEIIIDPFKATLSTFCSSLYNSPRQHLNPNKARSELNRDSQSTRIG